MKEVKQHLFSPSITDNSAALKALSNLLEENTFKEQELDSQLQHKLLDLVQHENKSLPFQIYPKVLD